MNQWISRDAQEQTASTCLPSLCAHGITFQIPTIKNKENNGTKGVLVVDDQFNDLIVAQFGHNRIGGVLRIHQPAMYERNVQHIKHNKLLGEFKVMDTNECQWKQEKMRQS